ncbi:type IV pilus assembly protein PilF [Alteromonadaceae bacterium Bs31]|nr:type IV pilus assembly protein PilF [Alteromonadaceae bacterium Bs31]
MCLRWFSKAFTAVLVVLFASGCVTNMDSSAKIRVDERQALEANIRLGMTYLQQNKREGAIRSFAKALEIDKNSAEAYLGMALIHQLNGEIKEAETNFKKALKSRVDFSRATIQFSYGRMLFEQERYKDALTQFEAAAADFAYQKRPDALVSVGRTSLALGDKVRARGAFEHALNLETRQAEASLELADLSFAERDYASAKKHLDQFSDAARHTPRSLWLGIRIERIFGNKDKEASYALALKNLYPYSQEYLDYKRFLEQN